jgi:hypothetical protein
MGGKMIKCKNGLFPELYFETDEEENTFNKYLESKGIFLHLHVYRIILQYEAKVLYSKLANYIMYDKGLRNVYYKYLSAVEEYYRAKLINNYDISRKLRNLKTETVNVDELIPTSHADSNLYMFTFSKNFTFSKLIDLLDGTNILETDEKRDLQKIKDFRNKVMHHNLLIIAVHENKEMVEKEINEIENVSKLIYAYLPDEMKEPFEYNINKCNHITKNNKIPNLEYMCLGEMINGLFK